MSPPTILLRPPPNVPFVQGFPGIAPALPQRPQAAVKGTVELRIGTQGVKAKWLRIELRKIEVLPGGGASNTYFDFVGQSPISLWQAQTDWNPIYTQDFPFYIRIPETVPPSITLEKSAGIRYELIATLAMKGKRGFFRRSAISSVTSTAPVTIDKHDLHSTWPIYSQPESRDVTSDALTLTVSRTQSCFGPGDRVPVMATLHSNNLSTVVLRAFEYVLKEVIIFRSGSHISSKGAAPQVKTTVIGEQKVPVNATLYGGTQHKLELATFIPQTHTSATIKTARHIDISYTINVKAVLGSGRSIGLDLPVIVSNWRRVASEEAIKRIGPVSGLSPDAATSHDSDSDEEDEYDDYLGNSFSRGTNGVRSLDKDLSEESKDRPNAFVSTQHGEMRNGILTGLTSASLNRCSNDLGSASNNNTQIKGVQPATFSGRSSATNLSAANGRRANSISNSISSNRPVITNEAELAKDSSLARPNTAQSPHNVTLRNNLTRASTDVARPSTESRPKTAPSERSASILANTARWRSAEEEKQMLFNRARADAERVQSSMGNDAFAHQTKAHVDAGPVLGPDSSSQLILDHSVLVALEAQKANLYEDAQARARQVQAQALQSPILNPVNPVSVHGHSISVSSTGGYNGPAPPSIALRSGSITSSIRNPTSSIGHTNGIEATYPAAAQRTYLSAEDEKAALRYYEAKLAVDRRQGDTEVDDAPQAADGPISYDALYPTANAGGASSRAVEHTSNGSTSHSLPQHDTKAPIANPTNYMVNTQAFSIPAENVYTFDDTVNHADRRRFDTRSSSNGRPSISSIQLQLESTHSVNQSQRPLPASRSQPLSPGISGARPLTAAEEKERLRLQYEAEDAGIVSASQDFSTPYGSDLSKLAMSAYNSSQNNFSTYGNSAVSLNPTTVPTPSPPPLMPRPPAEYIRETEEQDMRLRDESLLLREHPSSFADQLTGDHGHEILHRGFSLAKHPYASSNDTNAYSETHYLPLTPHIPPIHE